jgi:plasmid maintenance system killer protein
VEVYFRTSKLRKHTETIASAQREWGERRGKLLRRRLDELSAAPSLETMRKLPGARCHELTGNLKGKLAVDLDHPYRLLFEPAHDPAPCKDHGGLDWTKVTAIAVLEIIDYHG